MTNERARDEQTGSAITDLPTQEPKDEQASEVRGGKATPQDFKFVHSVDKSSPVLMQA